jgi:hypothetical protein
MRRDDRGVTATVRPRVVSRICLRRSSAACGEPRGSRRSPRWRRSRGGRPSSWAWRPSIRRWAVPSASRSSRRGRLGSSSSPPRSTTPKRSSVDSGHARGCGRGRGSCSWAGRWESCLIEAARSSPVVRCIRSSSGRRSRHGRSDSRGSSFWRCCSCAGRTGWRTTRPRSGRGSTSGASPACPRPRCSSCSSPR